MTAHSQDNLLFRGMFHNGHDELDLKLGSLTTSCLVRLDNQSDDDAVTLTVGGVNVHIGLGSGRVGIWLVTVCSQDNNEHNRRSES